VHEQQQKTGTGNIREEHRSPCMGVSSNQREAGCPVKGIAIYDIPKKEIKICRFLDNSFLILYICNDA
jgi:hypothetical protein